MWVANGFVLWYINILYSTEVWWWKTLTIFPTNLSLTVSRSIRQSFPHLTFVKVSFIKVSLSNFWNNMYDSQSTAWHCPEYSSFKVIAHISFVKLKMCFVACNNGSQSRKFFRVVFKKKAGDGSNRNILFEWEVGPVTNNGKGWELAMPAMACSWLLLDMHCCWKWPCQLLSISGLLHEGTPVEANHAS